jgi:Rieske Fe-S protein
MTDEPFPPTVGELAAAHRLGDPVRVFRPRFFGRLAAMLRRRSRPVPVYLFDGGLVRPPEAFGWDELSAVIAAGVRRRRAGRTRWQVTIEPVGGRAVGLADGLADMERLGEVVVAEVMRRVVPVYVAAVENGGSVSLGPFTVSGKGIEKDAELIPWPAVRAVGMNNGIVYVRRADEVARTGDTAGGTTAVTGGVTAAVSGVVTAAVTAARMPNAAAFIALCRHLGARVEEST